MPAPRKGHRASPARRTPERGSEGLVERLHAIIDAAANALESQPSPVLVAELESLANNLECKLTLTTPSLQVTGELDSEALCVQPTESSVGPGATEEMIINTLPRAKRKVLTIIRAAGRASMATHRPRRFAAVPPVDQEQQLERSRRSRQANDRRAFRKAADRAIATNCRTWITLSVRTEHLELDLTDARKKFLKSIRKVHSQTSQSRLAYVGAQVTEDGRPHIHLVISGEFNADEVRECWPYGYVHVQRISNLQIEQKVGYMIKNQSNGRSTHSRLFTSRGANLEREEIPVVDLEDARDQLRDRITPQEPRLVNASLFGGFPRASFRFDPIREEGDSPVASLEDYESE